MESISKCIQKQLSHYVKTPLIFPPLDQLIDLLLSLLLPLESILQNPGSPNMKGNILASKYS